VIRYQTIKVLWRDTIGKHDRRNPLQNACMVPDNEMNQAPAAINSQTLPAKNTFKYHYDFYIQSFKISSLNHVHEYTIYIYEEVDTVSVRSPDCRRSIWQLHSLLHTAEFNLHLTNPLILSHYWKYGVRGLELHFNRVVTLWSVSRRTTLDRRERVISPDG